MKGAFRSITWPNEVGLVMSGLTNALSEGIVVVLCESLENTGLALVNAGYTTRKGWLPRALVINEMRLDLSTERGQEVYDQIMRETLGLDGGA